MGAGVEMFWKTSGDGALGVLRSTKALCHGIEYTCDGDFLATERISNFTISWNRDILGKCVFYTFPAGQL